MFTLLVPSFLEQLWNKLLTTCNKLDGTTSLLQGCSNKTDTVMICNNIVTTLCCQLCDNLVATGLYQSSFEENLVSSLSTYCLTLDKQCEDNLLTAS